jgi:arylsulfatase A
MSRRIASLAVVLVSWAGVAGADEKPARPNIVFILADDLGIDGLGCYGSDRFKVLTPNLDALAKSGLKFERCYAAPVCGPSRVLIMTGRYAFRTGGLTNPSSKNPSSKDEPSIARTLKQAGYSTGMAGKWRQMGETPGDWGFDEWVTDPTASGWFWVKSYTKNGQLVEKETEFYYPDVQQEFALDFIRRHRDGPFYFYYSMHLVHGPIVRTPDSKAGGDLFADNVAYMDKQVGQLAAELDALGLRDKTLILFSVDNGTVARQSGTIGGRPIHGAKGSVLEGGSRVPLIASWKGTTPEGKSLPDLVGFSDLFATFAELAGAKMPEGIVFDSRSFAPQLRGERGTPREWLFIQLGPRWYVRDDRWKLTQAGELLDLKDAPFVERPVSDLEPGAADARKRLQAVLDQLNPAAGKKAEDPPKKKKKQP